MATPSNPQDSSPMGPLGASPFPPPPSKSIPAKLSKSFTPVSKNMAMWKKFLGSGATTKEVEKFQAGFLNAITSQIKQEAQKSRQRRKKDARMARGDPS